MPEPPTPVVGLTPSSLMRTSASSTVISAWVAVAGTVSVTAAAVVIDRAYWWPATSVGIIGATSTTCACTDEPTSRERSTLVLPSDAITVSSLLAMTTALHS